MHQFVTPEKMRSFHMKTLGNSMRMYPIIRKMKCTPVITHLSEFCSVLGRERKWWNNLLAELKNRLKISIFLWRKSCASR